MMKLKTHILCQHLKSTGLRVLDRKIHKFNRDEEKNFKYISNQFDLKREIFSSLNTQKCILGMFY